MPYITIDYSDGQYYVKELTEEEADRGMQQGDFAYVSESTVAAWKSHCQQADAFHTLWRTLDNELELKKRQAAPSIDQRKLARLEAELTEARKTADHFHSLWLKANKTK